MSPKTLSMAVLFCMFAANGFSAFNNIPRSWIVAIDDGGFIINLKCSKTMTPATYQAIIDAGKKAKIRIQVAFTMYHMDKSNICASPEYNAPVAAPNIWMTADGLNWNNSGLERPGDFDDIMNTVRNNAANIEFGLHGVAHTHHTVGGAIQDSEWADASVTPCQGWSWGDMDTHAKCFVELMRQYYDEETSPFPRNFVAEGHRYYYNASATDTTGAVLHTYGVKYANFNMLYTPIPQGSGQGAIDNGVLVLDRKAYDGYFGWSTKGGCPPAGKYGEVDYCFVESHMPNWDNYGNQWADYLAGANNNPDIYLAKNSNQCATQWLYRKYATISDSGGTVTINNSGMTDGAYTYDLLGNLVIKTALAGQHIASASINNNAQITGYYEDTYGYGYLIIGHKTNTMGRLDKQSYTLTYSLGGSYMPSYIDMVDATYNVYSFECGASNAVTKLEMYGTQDVKVRLPFTPTYVQSDNPNLVINTWNYSSPFLTMNVTGKNIQGEVGTITIANAMPAATQVAVSASPKIISADGVTPALITARVCGTNNNLITNSNATVTFNLSGTAGGSISATSIAASGGIAAITYTAGTTAGTATITATVAGLAAGSADITVASNHKPGAPTNLQCNKQTNPVGLMDLSPVLSWTCNDIDTGDIQSACRVLIADNQADINNNTGNVIDTNKIRLKTHTIIAKQLQQNTNYYWKVMVWDKYDLPSAYSQVNTIITGQRSFNGTLLQIPGTIKFVDFDNGGEGVAYHDVTSGGGDVYRPGESVDIMNDNVEGNVVVGADLSEWMEYSVNVQTAGTYTLELRVRSVKGYSYQGCMHIEFDGTDRTGAVIIPDTGGLWQTITINGVNLSAGRHIMKAFMDVDTEFVGPTGNFNYAKFTYAGAPPAGITLISPNGAETWNAGSQATVRWTSVNLTGNVNIDITTNGGTSWTSLAANAANSGAQAVTVPAALSTACKVRVQSTAGSPGDISDYNFTIASLVPAITVLSPNGGEVWNTGSQATVIWASANITGNVNIDITTDGSAWTSLAANAANDGSEPVMMPSAQSTTCKVRVQSVSGAPSDTSDGNFTLSVPVPSITVISPNGGESWQTGTNQTVTWTSANISGNVDIEVSLSGINGPWVAMKSATANDGTEAVTAPSTVSTTCRIRVKSVSGAPSDYSNSDFTLTATPQPVVSVNPASIDFGSIEQGQSGSNTLNITNSGAGTLSGALTASQPWITVNPDSFNSNSAAVTVSVNTTGLAGGANTGNITVTTNGGTAVVNITVNVTIPPGQDPHIALSTTSLNFGELELGMLSETKAFMIKNDGQGTLTGTISVSDSWITIDKTSLNLAAQAEEQVTVSVDNSILAQTEGPANGEITIISNGNNGAQVTTTISVEFAATCVLVKPNPVRLSSPLVGEGRGEGSITFFGDGIVAGQTTIKIYTLSGELVNILNPQSGICNTQSPQAPGIYIYVYESPKEKGVGKFTVIK